MNIKAGNWGLKTRSANYAEVSIITNKTWFYPE